jgi:hypothetical protein
MKTHLEIGFGPGLRTDSHYQKVMAGQTAEAYKTIRTIFLTMGKSPEEQEVFIKSLKVNLKKLARLNSIKPKAEDVLSGVGLSQTIPLSQGQEAQLTETTVGTAPSPAQSGSAQPNLANDLVGHSQVTGETHTPGLFDFVKGAVEKVAESPESGSLLRTLASMTLKNVKQTANYEERKEMRHLFKDLI